MDCQRHSFGHLAKEEGLVTDMRKISILSWTTQFPFDGKDHKADWAAYENETVDGCLTLHNISADDAEKVIRYLNSIEEMRKRPQTNQTSIGEAPPSPPSPPSDEGAQQRMMDEQNRPPHSATLVQRHGYDFFPPEVCEAKDLRVVLAHWVDCGVTTRSKLLELCEANQGRLAALSSVKDVRQKFNRTIAAVQLAAE